MTLTTLSPFHFLTLLPHPQADLVCEASSMKHIVFVYMRIKTTKKETSEKESIAVIVFEVVDP